MRSDGTLLLSWFPPCSVYNRPYPLRLLSWSWLLLYFIIHEEWNIKNAYRFICKTSHKQASPNPWSKKECPHLFRHGISNQKTSHRSLQKEFLSSISAKSVRRHILSSCPIRKHILLAKSAACCLLLFILRTSIFPRIQNEHMLNKKSKVPLPKHTLLFYFTFDSFHLR